MDLRPRVTVDKPVDLEALDRQLGSHGLSARVDDDGNVLEVVAPTVITQEQLEDAIESHGGH